MKWMVRFSKTQIVAFTWLFVTGGLVRSPVIRAQDAPKDLLRLIRNSGRPLAFRQGF
jgi:hypothetical protein